MHIPLLVELPLVSPMGDLNVRILLGRPGMGKVVGQTQLLALLLKFLQERSPVVCLYRSDREGEGIKTFLEEQGSIPWKIEIFKNNEQRLSTSQKTLF